MRVVGDASALKTRLLFELSICEELDKTSVLFLTGGNTILRIYKDVEFLEIITSFDRICFADERLVPINNIDSNIGNFLKFCSDDVLEKIEMILDDFNRVRETYVQNIHEYLTKPEFHCCCITGYGLDGHFWSLFSKDDFSQNDLILRTSSVKHKHNRITLGYKAFSLLKTNFFISTREKLKSFNSYPKEPLNSLMSEVFVI